jgi:hypothetical protein
MGIICSRADTVKKEGLGRIRCRKMDHWLAFGYRAREATTTLGAIEVWSQHICSCAV